MTNLIKICISVAALFAVQLFTAADVKAQGSERHVLLEIFTSTTCPPCAPQNNAFMNWYSSFPQADRVSVVKYPVHWPGSGCVFYHENPVPVNIRRNYYSINAAPTGVVDGVSLGSSASTWINRIQNNLGSPSPVSMTLSALHDGEGGLTVLADVSRLQGVEYPDGNVRMLVAIVERDIQYNAPNGSTVQHFVHRDMIPGATGTPVTLAEGESQSFGISGELDNSWDVTKLEVVAFVQEVGGQKRILQSQSVPVTEGDAVGVPTLVSPADGAEMVPFEETNFEWQTADLATAYDVVISETSGFETSVVQENGLGGTTFSTSLLEPETTYYWRVRGTNQEGAGPWSTTASFTTVMAPPGTEPMLLQPSDGAVIGSVTVSLIWQSVDQADTYHLRFAGNSSMDNPIHDVTGLESTSFSVTNLEDGSYYWKVRGENDGGPGEWSEIYTFQLETATSLDPGDELPDAVALHQNYPNPFNPTTLISFDLPDASEVRLAVYTLEGRLVTVLARQTMSAGTHSLQFDAASLSSGIYMYRLEAGAEVLSRKMMLIK